MNLPIPTRPCFSCGEPTNETQSAYGVGCHACFKAAFWKPLTDNLDREIEKLMPEWEKHFIK